QAEHIATAAAVNPRAEQGLLHTAARASLARLRDEAARRRAEADPDPEARQRRIHAARRLRRWTGPDGTWNLAASGTPDAGSRINAALDPLIDQYFHHARRQGRREDRDAYAFDALVQLATGHTQATAASPVTAGGTPATTPQHPHTTTVGHQTPGTPTGPAATGVDRPAGSGPAGP